MNIGDIKNLIRRAKTSVKKSLDIIYKEMVLQIIYDLEHNICFDQEIGSIDDLDDDWEIPDYLIKYVQALEDAVGP